MKKIILVMVMLMVCSIVYGSVVFESIQEREKVKVTMINQEPDPVTPGNFVDVRFRIENFRTEPLKNVDIKLGLKHPFSLYWSQDSVKNIGTLAPGQADETGVREKFRLKVGDNAVEGENIIEFWYRENKGGWQKAGDFFVDVRTANAVLAINEIKSETDKLLPGTKNKVHFKLENMADSVMRDIKLRIDLYSSTTTSGTVTTTELPFTPIGSSNEKTIDVLAPGKSENVYFDLFIDANADSKVYKVPFSLHYIDDIGSNFSKTGYVGLMVDAEPDISINLDSTDIYSVGTRGTITIKIVNKGFSDVKFLDLVMEETSDFDIMSNPEVYIGNIDSDDYETAEYTLLVNSGARGSLKLPLNIEYRDANGKLTKRDIDLELELFSGDALKQRVNGGGNNLVGIIIVIVIVAIGIVIWRWRKRKRRA